jgi:hypothetical protein
VVDRCWQILAFEVSEFRRPITRLSTAKMDEACRVLARALGCV